MSPSFLIIHHTYHTVIVGISHGSVVTQSREIPHRDANALLIPSVKLLLEKEGVTLNDLACIGCTTGPGPFTTVRTVVVTANGLGYATGLPLVGMSAIELRAQTAAQVPYAHTFALYNAFNNDLYVTHYDHVTRNFSTRVMFRDHCIHYLQEFLTNHAPEKIQLVGNGIALHRDSLVLAGLITPDYTPPVDDFPTIEEVAPSVLQAWRNEETTPVLVPYYGKEYSSPSMQQRT